MKKSRKIKVSVLAASLSALLLIGFTLAYLTDMRAVTNILGFNSGGSNGREGTQISLTEPAFVAQVGAENATFIDANGKEISSATLRGIEPGDSIQKDPTITNVGYEDVYLRVTFTDANQAALTKLMDEAGLKINPDFVLASDGYYYYGTETNAAAKTGQGKLLQAGDVTGQSVDFFVLDENNVSIHIPLSWDRADFTELNLKADGSLDMIIQAEALQSANYTGAYPWVDTEDQPIVATSIDADNR